MALTHSTAAPRLPMMSVPVVVLFLVLQKYFVRALTEGAVKS